MARYCPFCGRSIPLDARVCAYCGKSLGLNEGMRTPEPQQKKDKAVWIVVIVLALVIIIPIAISATVYVYVSGLVGSNPTNYSSRDISLVQNDNTLIVTGVYPNDLDWSEVVVSTGSAILPTGVIDTGDTITNCEYYVTLRWESTYELIGYWDFT